MIFKNISKTKLSLALISLAITFFVWQQGLRDSLSRPSVSFDISQKEQEIVELAAQSIPTNLKNFLITNDPVDQINNALSEVSFNELSERNKLIWIVSSESNASIIEKNLFKEYKNKKPLTVVKPGTQTRRFTHISDTVDICYMAWKRNFCRHYSISNKKSHSIIDVAKMFKSKIHFLPSRKGERYASALTTLSLSNKIYSSYGKIMLKEYIQSFLKKHKKKSNF